MSVFDEFRELTTDLFSAFEAPSATISRTVPGTRSKADRAAGIVASSTVTSTVRAILGKRRVKATDGTYRTETIARIDGPARDGDKLTIGASTYTVTSVDEINPDGSTPLLYVVTLS